MRLPRKIEQALVIFAAFCIVVVMAVVFGIQTRNTFAEGEEEVATFDTEGPKFVTFYDNGNGEKLIVKTEAKTVGEALERAGIMISVGDIVEPGLDTAINADNYFVNIYRGRPVVVRDGVIDKYLMTASHDAATIAKEAGLTVYDGDEIALVTNSSFLEAGAVSVYELTRNGGRTVTEEVEIAFNEETVRDVNLESGKSEVQQLGEVGMKRVVYNVQYVDNVEVSREVISEEVVREPVARVTAVGARKSVPPEAGTCAEWARAAGVSEANLPLAIDLIYHESGCRVDAQNPSGAYGIPQALPGSKMAAYGADWETNPVTQMKWMINYVTERYGGWSQALEYWYDHGWY